MRKNKVMVIGDIMLDQFNSGVVNRISPESPVPVVKIQKEYCRLGGAANVANNIVALGGEVLLIGMTGNDRAGRRIHELLKENQINDKGIIIDSGFRTIRKVRVLGNNQQIVRIDYNEEQNLSEENIKQLFTLISHEVKKYDLVILSDYEKGICEYGFCRQVINLCRDYKIPVLADPKGTNWEKYRGVTLISPNLKEISEYLSIDISNKDRDIEDKCYSLYKKLDIQYLMITRSEKGMTLINEKNKFYHFPSKAKEVYDVSGAGDTVMAVMALFWNKSNDLLNVICLANDAAGIAVGKKGTAVVFQKELEEEYGKQIKSIGEKIVTKKELIEIVQKWRDRGESIVFTNGCYDIFHKGHVYAICSAAQFGQHLIVAINSDASVRRLKGEARPVNNELDRSCVVSALGCVDNVIIFDEDTPELLLKEIRPDILVKGSDYKVEDVVGREYAERVELIPYIDGYSSTGIIRQMAERK